MLDLDSGREASAPRPAATLVLLRDATPTGAVEVFCVERNKTSRFLGGAIVFPGGRVEDDDGSETWRALVTRDDAHRALGVAACRETLEEAAILLADAPVSNDEALALRTRLATDATALRAFLVERKSKLDLASLVVMSRWITPKAESRRFDAHFFVARAPHGQRGVHDMTETMSSFWASPRDVLARFDRSEIQLAPPTHRTLQLLAEYTHVEAALSAFRDAKLDPICPELVQQGDTLALTLPGDPEHSIREPRIAGTSRYVLRDAHWRAEPAP